MPLYYTEHRIGQDESHCAGSGNKRVMGHELQELGGRWYKVTEF